MKIIPIEIKVTRTYYIAFDGVWFEESEDCLAYEDFIKTIGMVDYTEYLFESPESRWYILRTPQEVMTTLSYMHLDLDKMDPISDPVTDNAETLVRPVLLIVEPDKEKSVVYQGVYVLVIKKWGLYTIDTFKEMSEFEKKFKIVRDMDALEKDAYYCKIQLGLITFPQPNENSDS